jgi:dihydrofolate reductase
MKPTTTTQVSADGVMQANGGRDEELDPGMERGGWATPLFDNEAMTFVNQVYQRADAFLFGRRTYDLFAGYWRVQSGNPIADALNSRPKYVASNTLTDPRAASPTTPTTATGHASTRVSCPPRAISGLLGRSDASR